jgi:DNA-binding response OmpR family regulator
MAHIVVMEDDAGTRLIVSGILRKVGHTVHEAVDGVQGLALVEQIKPDLVVSDVQMPQMNGMQVLRSLRADSRFAQTPVILLTGIDDGPAMMRSMEQGAQDYIIKPCKASALIDAVNAQLRSASAALHGHAGDPAAAMPLGQTNTQSGGTVRGLPLASLVLAELRNANALSIELGPADWLAFKHSLMAELANSAQLAHALTMALVGDHVLAVFADTGPGTPKRTHAQRAAQTLLAWSSEANQICGRMLTLNKSSLRTLPQLAFSLHAGAVQLLDNSVQAPGLPPTPMGDALTQLLRLRGGIPVVPWPMVATAQALALLPGALRIGAQERVMLSNTALDVYAVLGAASRTGAA